MNGRRTVWHQQGTEIFTCRFCPAFRLQYEQPLPDAYLARHLAVRPLFDASVPQFAQLRGCPSQLLSELYRRRRPRSSEPITPPPSPPEAHRLQLTVAPSHHSRRYTPPSLVPPWRPADDTQAPPCHAPGAQIPWSIHQARGWGRLGYSAGVLTSSHKVPARAEGGGASHNRSQPRNGLGLDRYTA